MDDLQRLIRFSRRQPRMEKFPGSGRFYVPTSTFKENKRMQLSTVKVTYAAASNLNTFRSYLVKEGKGLDGKSPELFTSSDDKAANLEPLKGEKRFFRVMISPDKGNQMDLKEHARVVMDELSKSLGRKLEWFAAVHYDKEHRHVHIGIRGVADGKELIIPPYMIKQGIRQISRNDCTRNLGYYTDLDLALQKQKEITAERFTSLDRNILNRVDNNFQIKPQVTVLQKRLEYLDRIGLATKTDKQTFQLVPNLEKQLRDLSYQNDIHKMHWHVIEKDRKNVFMYKSTMEVSGKIVNKGINDDEPCILIESGNKLYHASGYKYLNCEIGQNISLQNGRAFYQGKLLYDKNVEISRPQPDQKKAKDQDKGRDL